MKYLILFSSILFFIGCNARMDVAGTNATDGSDGYFGKPVPESTVLASIQAASFDLPENVPLGGFGGSNRRSWDYKNKYPYATWFKPAKGVLDDVRAKVMVLKDDGKLLVWVNMDLVGIQRGFREDLIRELAVFGVTDTNLMISATHTHSGPGAMGDNFALEIIAIDKFQPKLYARVLNQVKEMVVAGISDLKPALIYHTKFNVDGLQSNRMIHDAPIDTQADVLMLKSGGRWMGGVLHFAIHSTALGSANLYLSSDISGSLENHMEKAMMEMNGTVDPVYFMHVQGAEGDVTTVNKGTDGMKIAGAKFTAAAMSAMEDAKIVNPKWVSSSVPVDLGTPFVGIKHCVNNEFVRKLVYKKLKLKISKWFPKKSDMMILRLGPILMATWPGEPTSSLGFQMKHIGAKYGFDNTWVLGLTNDYLSYFTGPEEYNLLGTEPCSSFYGKNGGTKFVDAFDAALSTGVMGLPDYGLENPENFQDFGQN